MERKVRVINHMMCEKEKTTRRKAKIAQEAFTEYLQERKKLKN